MKKLFLILLLIFTFYLPLYAGDISKEDNVVSSPVVCGENTVNPIMIVRYEEDPCPGGIYCGHPLCGEMCCPSGYWYSNTCTCMCYRTSDEASRDCHRGYHICTGWRK